MATSSIGEHQFVTLANVSGQGGGAPMLPQQMTEIEERPGADGVSVLLTGKKGLPFQMASGRDVDDREAAEATLRAYANMPGEIVNIVWNGVDYSAEHEVKFVVLAPVEVRMQRLAAASGGLSTSKGYWVAALWNLIAFKL